MRTETMTMTILRAELGEKLKSFRDDLELDYAKNQFGFAFAVSTDLEEVRKVHPYESTIEVDEVIVHSDLELSQTFLETAKTTKDIDFDVVVDELVDDVLVKLANREDALMAF